MTKIAVLGAGAWGVTLADLLAGKNNQVVVWDVDAAALDVLRRERTRGRPPGLKVHESVEFEPNFAAALKDAEVIVSVVPSHAVRPTCQQLIATRSDAGKIIFVSCSKGIEEDTLMLPSEIYEQVMGPEHAGSFVALSGPSHAEEVCKRIPTVVVASSTSTANAEFVRDLFILPTFRVYTQDDCRGVEMGAALKNVIAIAAGITDGLGYGDNTKAALITRGLAEITRAACAGGAKAQTLAGLAGLGDLVVTAMSRHSRNRGFGELIGRGLPADEALRQVGQIVEGYRTARSAHDLAARLGIEMPIVSSVYSVLYEGVSVTEACDALLQREPKPEVY